jgi:acyl carrier protein
MISNEDLFSCVAKGLKVNIKKITINSSSKDFEQWDSLGHLDIMLNLDKILKGKALKITNISEAYSVKKIVKILKSKKLLK